MCLSWGADFWIEAFCPLSLDQEIVLLTSSRYGFFYQSAVVCASENETKSQSSPLLGFLDAVISRHLQRIVFRHFLFPER